MSLWDKLGDEKLIELNRKKKEMAQKVAKGYSPSGQRHDFDRKYHDTGKPWQFRPKK